MIHLSKRLRTVVNFVEGNVLADIGCDHGYVCIQSIQESRVKKAYACDVAKSPLENAQRTIEKEKLTQSISCILMNGLEKLPEDVDVVVMSGMGSSLMIQILSASLDKIKVGTKFICGPQKDIHLFRQYLAQHGFEILNEKVIYEDNHYYSIFKLLYSNISYTLNNEEIYYGSRVEKDQTYSEFIETEYQKWNRIYQQLPEAKKQTLEKRMDALKKIRI